MKTVLVFFVCLAVASLVDAQTCSATDLNNCVQAHYNCPMNTQEQTCQCYINFYACLAPVGCLTKSNTDYERQTCINKFCDAETVCNPDLSQNGQVMPASPMSPMPAPTTPSAVPSTAFMTTVSFLLLLITMTVLLH